MRAAVLSRTKRFAQSEKRKERTRKPEVSGSVLSIPFP
nr:MAG TPA: hypothetical protein [Inoviridae sp.]